MNDGALYGLSAAMLMLISSLISGIVFYGVGVQAERNAAIQANVAEWLVNNRTGETKFRYKTIYNDSQRESNE